MNDSNSAGPSTREHEFSRQLTHVPGLLRCTGSVVGIRGPLVLARIPLAAIGTGVTIHTSSGNALRGSVVAFNDDTVCVAPFGPLDGVSPGTLVSSLGEPHLVSIPADHLGAVLDPFGDRLDRAHVPQEFRNELSEARGSAAPMPTRLGRPRLDRSAIAGDYLRLSPSNPPPSPLDRSISAKQLVTGIRAIDGCVPIAYGQRIAVAAPAGTGKSTLVGMIADSSDVDVVVVGLIGERGREIREFIELTMGSETMKRACVVCSTSDQPALLRALAAQTAQSIAEYHRDRGCRVLLVIDSLTRLARAWREVGLASGEFPVRHGYPPSVFEQLPRFLERAGSGKSGNITAFYTLLQDGPADSDPLLHEVQSILDGHLQLSSEIAARGIRPAIDLSASLSRFAQRLVTQAECAVRQKIVRLFGRAHSDRDLLLLGGTPDPELRLGIQLEGMISEFLNQPFGERTPLEQTRNLIEGISQQISLNALE